jgi:hypothetical protein
MVLGFKLSVWRWQASLWRDDTKERVLGLRWILTRLLRVSEEVSRVVALVVKCFLFGSLCPLLSFSLDGRI